MIRDASIDSKSATLSLLTAGSSGTSSKFAPLPSRERSAESKDLLSIVFGFGVWATILFTVITGALPSSLAHCCHRFLHAQGTSKGSSWSPPTWVDIRVNWRDKISDLVRGWPVIGRSVRCAFGEQVLIDSVLASCRR